MQERMSQCLDYVVCFKVAVFASPNIQSRLQDFKLTPANLLSFVSHKADKFSKGQMRIQFLDSKEFNPVLVSSMQQNVVQHLSKQHMNYQPPQFCTLGDGIQKYLQSQDFYWFLWTSKIIVDLSTRARAGFLMKPFGIVYMFSGKDSKKQINYLVSQAQKLHKQNKKNIIIMAVVIKEQQDSKQIQQQLSKQPFFKSRKIIILKIGQQIIIQYYTPRHNFHSPNYYQTKLSLSLNSQSYKSLRTSINQYTQKVQKQVYSRILILQPQYDKSKQNFGSILSAMKSLFSVGQKQRQKKKLQMDHTLQLADISFMAGNYDLAYEAYGYLQGMIRDNLANQKRLVVGHAVAMQALCLIQKRRKQAISIKQQFIQSLKKNLVSQGDNYTALFCLFLLTLIANTFDKRSRSFITTNFQDIFKKLSHTEYNQTIRCTLNLIKEQYAVLYLRLPTPWVWKYFQIMYQLSKTLLQKLPRQALRCYLISSQGFNNISCISSNCYLYIVKLYCKIYRQKKSYPFLRIFLNKMAQLPRQKNIKTVQNIIVLLKHYQDTQNDTSFYQSPLVQPSLPKFPTILYETIQIVTQKQINNKVSQNVKDTSFRNMAQQFFQYQLTVLSYAKGAQFQIPINYNQINKKRCYVRKVQVQEQLIVKFQLRNDYFYPFRVVNLKPLSTDQLEFEPIQELYLQPEVINEITIKGKFIKTGRAKITGLQWKFSFQRSFISNHNYFNMHRGLIKKQRQQNYFQFIVQQQKGKITLQKIDMLQQVAVGQIQDITITLKPQLNQQFKYGFVKGVIDHPELILNKPLINLDPNAQIVKDQVKQQKSSKKNFFRKYKLFEFYKNNQNYQLKVKLLTPSQGINIIRVLTAYSIIFNQKKLYKTIEIQLSINAKQILIPSKIKTQFLDRYKRLCQIYMSKGQLCQPKNNTKIISAIFNEDTQLKIYPPLLIESRYGYMLNILTNQRTDQKHQAQIQGQSKLGQQARQLLKLQQKESEAIAIQYTYQRQENLHRGLLVITKEMQKQKSQLPVLINFQHKLLTQPGKLPALFQVVLTISNNYRSDIQFKIIFSEDDKIFFKYGFVFWTGLHSKIMHLQEKGQQSITNQVIVTQSHYFDLARVRLDYVYKNGKILKYSGSQNSNSLIQKKLPCECFVKT